MNKGKKLLGAALAAVMTVSLCAGMKTMNVKAEESSIVSAAADDQDADTILQNAVDRVAGVLGKNLTVSLDEETAQEEILNVIVEAINSPDIAVGFSKFSIEPDSSCNNKVTLQIRLAYQGQDRYFNSFACISNQSVLDSYVKESAASLDALKDSASKDTDADVIWEVLTNVKHSNNVYRNIWAEDNAQFEQIEPTFEKEGSFSGVIGLTCYDASATLTFNWTIPKLQMNDQDVVDQYKAEAVSKLEAVRAKVSADTSKADIMQVLDALKSGNEIYKNLYVAGDWEPVMVMPTTVREGSMKAQIGLMQGEAANTITIDWTIPKLQTADGDKDAMDRVKRKLTSFNKTMFDAVPSAEEVLRLANVAIGTKDGVMLAWVSAPVITPPNGKDAGTVKGTLKLTKGALSDTFDLMMTIKNDTSEKPGMTDREALDKAKKAIEQILKEELPNQVTEEDYIAKIKDVIQGTNVEVSWESKPEIVRSSGQKNGYLRGMLLLTKGSLTDTVYVNHVLLNDTPAPENIYKYTEGENSTWTAGSKAGMTFKLNGNYDEFSGVKVNGKLLDESLYTAAKGSTIITLKPEYLNTLKAGTYTLEVLYTNGQAPKTTFTIKAAAAGKPAAATPGAAAPEKTAPSKSSNTPKTGDTTNAAAAIALVLLSGAGLLVGIKKRKFL